MTITNRNPYLRFVILLMVSVSVLVSSFSLTALQQGEPKASAYEETSSEWGHAQQAQWGPKQSFSQQRLLPTPAFPFLFIILSLIVVLGVARVLLFMYPEIFLLRKIELLLPIKFTSI